ncbi:MAG: nucleotidyltransferase domain-containing protein [Selenomonadaceae bacterium]|nr:nucleotidyltransferase domain-containing protein [Selenomonadaceae bacterium]
MNTQVKNMLTEYVEIIKKIYADKLAKIILYGSYARGDYNAESDIDIMILIDDDEVFSRTKNDELYARTFDFTMEHDVFVEACVKSKHTYDFWNEVHPYYRNIKTEGVILYEAA